MHQHLADFAIEKGSDNFISFLADYFYQKKEIEKSFNLYKTLAEHQYDIKYVKTKLYKVGFALAKIDKAEGKIEDARELAERYAGDDKNLNKFKRGYIKGFKK